MFNKNAYNILPQGSQLHHHFHTGGDEIFFHHHHEDDDILSGHYFSSSSSAAVNAPAVDAAAFYSIHHQEAAIDPCPKTTKKDRHSKIYTSQGPRDRRVRLSIGVARRFFDLQETLGFDKPSKTLDWLLTNSKTAIKDLMQQQQQQQTKESENVSSPSSECEAKRKLGGDRKCADLVKESRVKARARARERTREKMCIKQLHHNNNNNDDFNSSSSNNIPVDQFCRITTNNNHSHINFHSHPAYEEAPRRNDQDLIQIKRKVKHFMSTSNYGAPSPNYITPTENWDICAILDSHKFINSTSDN